LNHLERFRALMDFQSVDRLPRVEWASWWDKTIDRWRGEGLPAGLADGFDIRTHFGLDPYLQAWFTAIGPGYPSTGVHGRGAVASMDDYERVLAHLYPAPEARLAPLAARADAAKRGDLVVWITVDGFFWFARSLLGIERHLFAFYDQPALLHRINRDLAAYHRRVLEAVGKACPPAFMTFAEDMSYNHGPMLSKRLFEEFLAPYYREVIPLARELGIRVIVDSDGDVTEMVPWLEAAGIEGVLPLERQAGVDAALLRRRHPRLLMIGHYDKMVMARGKAAMRAEFERLLPAAQAGGFLPSVDHQTPPGVSLDEYRTYLGLLEEYSVRAAPHAP